MDTRRRGADAPGSEPFESPGFSLDAGDFASTMNEDLDQNSNARKQAEVKMEHEKKTRSCKARRQKKVTEADSNSDGDVQEDYSHEMLQKRLKTLTDEKEIKRLKRLLRNRVSAQQARERKKQYISDLEAQLDEKKKEIESMHSKMQRVMADNSTLRRLIITMRGHSAQPTNRPSSSHGIGNNQEVYQNQSVVNANQDQARLRIGRSQAPRQSNNFEPNNYSGF